MPELDLWLGQRNNSYIVHFVTQPCELTVRVTPSFNANTIGTAMATNKFLIAALFSVMLAGCASMDTSRPEYQGADQVGAIDMNMLVGTWQVEVLTPRRSDPPLDAQITISADGSTSGYSSADLSDRGADLVIYDVTGNWSVDGDTINQTILTADQSAGTPFAAMGVSLSMGLVEGQTTQSNVYEASADQLIIVTVNDGIASRYTRLK